MEWKVERTAVVSVPWYLKWVELARGWKNINDQFLKPVCSLLSFARNAKNLLHWKTETEIKLKGIIIKDAKYTLKDYWTPIFMQPIKSRQPSVY